MPELPIKFRIHLIDGDTIDVEVDESAYRLYNEDAEDAAVAIASLQVGQAISHLIKEVEYR